MINLVLFGKPGSGKGTQGEFLKSKYQLFHISTGDLFRHHISNQTALGKLAQSYIDKGDLVPDQLTIDMLKDAVENNPEAEGFIFDGFPRNLNQATTLDKSLEEISVTLDKAVFIDVNHEILKDRILTRINETSLEDRRSDDNVETLMKRIEV